MNNRSPYYKVSDAFYKNTIPIPRPSNVPNHVPSHVPRPPPSYSGPRVVEKKEQSLMDTNNTSNNTDDGGSNIGKHSDNYTLSLKYVTKNYDNTANPQVWGPAFWFILHNASARYPEKASPIAMEGMKGFILGMPYMIPCDNCSEHARAHIEKNYDRLNEICSGRDKLFTFFWDFHNYVNKRYNKPIMGLQEAFNMYTKGVNVTTLQYTDN